MTALVFASAVAFNPSFTTSRCAGVGSSLGSGGIASARRQLKTAAHAPGRPEVGTALVGEGCLYFI